MCRWLGVVVLWLMGLTLAYAQSGRMRDPLQDSGQQCAQLEVIGPDQVRRQVASTRTEVRVQIHGLVAQARVRQQFVNPGEAWLEARYLLPLPATSAVYGMRIELPDRSIEGEIREREAARIEYEAAKQEGMVSGLVEQQREHLFETRIANIAPGATVTVEVDYWQTLEYHDGQFEWRFPLTVRPRYAVTQTDDVGTVLDQIDPPQAGGEVQTAQIEIALEAGLAISPPTSPSHQILSSKRGSVFQLGLASDQVPLDRDFVLRWSAAGGQKPMAALFHERLNGEDYALLMLVPPTQSRGPRLQRELVLVLDSSGSMMGAAWEGARRAAHQALDQLAPGDRFALVDFDSAPNPWRPQSELVNAENIAAAHAWIDTLSADGGTEIEAALRTALALPETAGFVRQLVFVTDGAVGNEGQIYAALSQMRGSARLFTVGLGDAPNQAFLRKLAELGAGTSTLVSRLDEVESGMQGLFAQLDAPLLTRLDVRWPSIAEAYPQTLPDLYRGQPLLLVAKLAHLNAPIEVSGNMSGGHWQQQLSVTPVPSAGIVRLWARRKIGSLEDQITLGGDEARFKAEILEVALANKLLSRYTSFVAIEKRKLRPDGQPLLPTEFANPPPADAMAFAQGALGWQMQLLLAAGLLLVGLWLLSGTRRSAA